MVDVVTEAFVSQNLPITMECFRTGETAQPAILLLHGANGLTTHHDWHRRVATLLAQSGYVVFFVHYFESTGTRLATRETARENFLQWRRAVIDAVGFIAAHSGVVSDQIGFLGLSLGATVAVSVAGQIPHIRAEAVFFGEVPDSGWGFITNLPPTLILHGASDQVIPVAQAHKMERWLKERNIPCEIKIYPEEGHIFREAAASDAVAVAIDFFHRYLPTSDAYRFGTSANTGRDSEPPAGEEIPRSGLVT